MSAPKPLTPELLEHLREQTIGRQDYVASVRLGELATLLAAFDAQTRDLDVARAKLVEGGRLNSDLRKNIRGLERNMLAGRDNLARARLDATIEQRRAREELERLQWAARSLLAELPRYCKRLKTAVAIDELVAVKMRPIPDPPAGIDNDTFRVHDDCEVPRFRPALLVQVPTLLSQMADQLKPAPELCTACTVAMFEGGGTYQPCAACAGKQDVADG